MNLTWGPGLLLAVAAVAIGLGSLLLQKEYLVHSKGIVVVTGASSGIGRHFVESFAAGNSGFTVLAGVRKESDAESIRAVGLANLLPWVIDVSSPTSCADASEFVKKMTSEKSLPLVALVNNAGTSRNFPVEFHDLDDVQALYDINVFGMLRITQMLLPLLRQYQGRVVQISSLNGRIATPRQSVYASTKFAMEAMSDGLRREVSSFGVSVSVVEPAYVKTAIFTRVAEANRRFEEEHAAESGLAKQIYAHLYTPEKLAKKKEELSMADEPTVTSRVIEHAIVSSKPKTRYVVANVGGVPAAVLDWVVWALPDRAVDILLS